MTALLLCIGYLVGRVVGCAIERIGPSEPHWLWIYSALAATYIAIALVVMLA